MKRLIIRLFDLFSDHPTTTAIILLTIFLTIFALGGIFKDTIIPKILAVSIIAFFVIVIFIAISEDYKELEQLRKEKRKQIEKQLFDSSDKKRHVK